MNHSDDTAKVNQIDTEQWNHFRERKKEIIRYKLHTNVFGNWSKLLKSWKCRHDINGVKINNNMLSDAFANNFSNKVKILTQTSPAVHEDMYNGLYKLMVLDRFLMDQDIIKYCLPCLNKKS
jgi:hypothetical protein